MTKLKICGITRLEDAQFCADRGVDFIGFIFAKSPRQISLSQAEKIISSLPPSPYGLRRASVPRTVGVFAEEKLEVIEETVKLCHLNYVQLHGLETSDFCAKISVPVIKAFCLKDKINLEQIKAYKTFAYLLDTYQVGQRGGTGKTFDWNLALEIKKLGVPIFLSGGLNPENIREAIEKVQPFAVDVSSGVESAPGIKDHVKIQRIIDITKKRKDQSN